MAAALEMKVRQTVVKSFQCHNCTADKSIEPLSAYTDKARENLLFKNFKECIATCETGISHAHVDHINQSGVSDKIEALCILAIQAYAELDNWQQVLPFVQQVFGSVEHVLLHAKIKEYTKCHAMSSVWLRHPDNFHKDGYSDLVSVCIQHILLPQGKTDIIQQYLDSCPGLSDAERRGILECFSGSIQKFSSCDKTVSDLNRASSLDEPDPVETNDEEKHSRDNRLTRFTKILVTKIKIYNLETAMKVAVAAVVLYLITVHGNNGDFTSMFGRIGTLGKGLLKLLRSVFWPVPALT